MTGQMEELVQMERLMIAYEEVSPGEEFKSKHELLVRPDRKFVETSEVEVRQAPFSTSRKVPARLYLFEDLLIVAVPNGAGTPKSIGSMLASEELGKHTTLKRFRNKYKVLSWLDLHRCSVKLAGTEVIQVTFVTRHGEEVKKGGTMRIVTRVEKIELWCSSEAASNLFTQLTCFIEDLIDHDLRRASLGSMAETASVDSAGGESAITAGDDFDSGAMERTRSWASRKNALRRNGTLKSQKGSGTLPRRHGSTHSAASMDSESVGGLSLADIESRYNLNLDAPSLPDGSVEFCVDFGEGMMGFSLSSGPSVGVIVGRIAEQSFSDEAGVCIGDRIVEVDDEPIGMEVKWQDVVEKIKNKPRPLRIKFERFAGRIKDTASDGTKGDGDGSDSKAQLNKQRRWAKKKQARAHASPESDERLISLGEMERLYRSGKKTENNDTFKQILGLFENVRSKDSSEPYQLAASVLQEIWSTERTYVLDLRTLVREFIVPLRRKVKRAKCKDLEGSRICEHGVRRATCSSPSSGSLISNEDMRTIFANIETLIKINTELLNYIESALLALNGSADVIELTKLYGPAFEKVMPFFKLYGVYCHQYPTAIDTLLICRTSSPELNTILADREKRAHVSLNSLLIKPVQRICKYPLLFRELLRHTSNLRTQGIAEHIAELEHSAKVVEALAASVNQIVGQHESSETLIDVFNELGGEAAVPWLVTPHRKFVTRLNVLLHEAPFQGEAKLHVMYVCSDIVLFGKGKEIGTLGTGGKTGGRKGRAVSLKRAFGNSLKKGLRTSVRATSSSHKSGNRTLGKPAIKHVKTIDIKSITPTLLKDKDPQGFVGIELKCVEREMEAAKGGTGKFITKINKLQIWLATEDERAGVYEDLVENIERQKNAEMGHKKAQQEHGTPKATRNWKSGRATNQASLRRSGHASLAKKA